MDAVITREGSDAGAPTRAPRQGRSRASFERMLASAEELLRERGNDDFTLTEVSKVGKVSIGSIYCRFDSKDDLIRAVHARTMEQMRVKQAEMVARAEARGGTRLAQLVPVVVDELAEMLAEQAPLMRPLMTRASTDEIVATVGKLGYADCLDRVTASLLAHRDEITHSDPERAVVACFNMIYAPIARFLGFGSSATSVGQGDWTELKADLGEMTTCFLTFPR